MSLSLITLDLSFQVPVVLPVGFHFFKGHPKVSAYISVKFISATLPLCSALRWWERVTASSGVNNPGSLLWNCTLRVDGGVLTVQTLLQSDPHRCSDSSSALIYTTLKDKSGECHFLFLRLWTLKGCITVLFSITQWLKSNCLMLSVKRRFILSRTPRVHFKAGCQWKVTISFLLPSLSSKIKLILS